MLGQPSIGMPFNTAAGAPATANGGQLIADGRPSEQISRLPVPPTHQQEQQRPLQRQRQPRQSLRSSILGAAAPAPARPSRLRASVETLVRKLSRHSLRSPSPPPEQQPPIASPAASPSTSTTFPNGPPTPTLPNEPPTLEASLNFPRDDWTVHRVFGDLYHHPDASPSQDPVLARGSPIQVEEDIPPERASNIVAMRPSGVYLSYNLGDRMELDHESGSVPSPAIIHYADPIEPLPPQSMEAMAPAIDLEVDEAFFDGSNNAAEKTAGMDCEDDFLASDAALIENFRAMRRSTPGGMVRRNVDGISLRYRLSADAALRCKNLVRSKPRMRKRKKMLRTDGGRERETITDDRADHHLVISQPS